MFNRAVEESDQMFPIFIFDPVDFRNTKLGFPKTGAFKAKFMIESVDNLRKNLREKGSDLIIRVGNTTEIFKTLINDLSINAVYTSQDVTYEELEKIDEVKRTLQHQNMVLKMVWQSTLFHIEDIPWDTHGIPDIYTEFRKGVENQSVVRAEVDNPENLTYVGDYEPGELPSLRSLGLQEESFDARAAIKPKGGEKAAWHRLNEYLWENDNIATYKETRNGMIGSEYSSKLSPWLALGCISPKSIYHEIKRYEAERTKNDSTYWLIFELIWRDFFRFMALKYGKQIFFEQGFAGKGITFNNDHEKFALWRAGRTGNQFVDANMKELLLTGFMSNRGRQNVASYLIHDLKVNWTWGAMWFESRLVDYDVCSNWLNWAYIAGVGNDPRQGRHFDIRKQQEMYDPEGAYVNLWIGQ